MHEHPPTATEHSVDGLEAENSALRARVEQLEKERRVFLKDRLYRERAENNVRNALVKKSEQLIEANQKLKDNQAKLVHSEKMAGLGQLAAGVAHEINNPVGFVTSNLGTLSGYVETFRKLFAEYQRLLDAARDGETDAIGGIVEVIEKIQEEEDLDYILGDVGQLVSESMDGTQRVKEIVEGLRSFARLDEAEVKESDINESIESTLKVVWNELKYRCEVRKELGTLPLIRCHPGQLNQVFMNLFVNAAQAIPEKGEITVETQATETEIIVRVSDTGGGIPPRELSKLFDPFFTTKPVGQGTGLGLSISHGIVQKHNGSIEVESEVGKGTTFTIRLPIEGIGHE